MLNIYCKGCNKDKQPSEFYLISGGLKNLEVSDMRFNICKKCVEEYKEGNKWLNKKKQICYKYLKSQHIACYYGALKYISIAKDKISIDAQLLKEIVSKIDNGYRKNSPSLERAVENFISLFGKKYGRDDWNERQQEIFNRLESNKENIKNEIEAILQEDYLEFKSFKQRNIK